MPDGTTPHHVAFVNSGFVSEISDGKSSGSFIVAKTGTAGNSGQTSDSQSQTYETATEIVTVTVIFVYDADDNLINVDVKTTRTKKQTSEK